MSDHVRTLLSSLLLSSLPIAHYLDRLCCTAGCACSIAQSSSTARHVALQSCAVWHVAKLVKRSVQVYEEEAIVEALGRNGTVPHSPGERADVTQLRPCFDMMMLLQQLHADFCLAQLPGPAALSQSVVRSQARLPRGFIWEYIADLEADQQIALLVWAGSVLG